MLDFDGKVAVVTGAGRGMGRCHALALAERGARVLVNDVGGDLTGAGSSSAPASAVAAEIRAAGGVANANAGSIATAAGCETLIEAAVSEFGRVDAIIHNAGISTFVPVAETTDEALDPILDVHLRAAIHLTRAAWPHFVLQGGGRMLYISSGAGLYGLPGCAHYGSAKTALVSLARTVSQEGREQGIAANVLAVMAMTRMMEQVVGEGPDLAAWWRAYMRPELTSAAAVWLVHQACPAAGQTYHTAGGGVAQVLLAETRGYTSLELTPEDVHDHFDEIHDRTGWHVAEDGARAADVVIDRVVRAGAPAPPGPAFGDHSRGD